MMESGQGWQALLIERNYSGTKWQRHPSADGHKAERKRTNVPHAGSHL